jgi:hypothetical protein
MIAAKEKAQGQTTCAVDISPKTVAAGADITLVGMVWCTPRIDLRGKPFVIRDQDGAPTGSAELTEYDGETNTVEFVVKAPPKAGDYTWFAVCPKHESDDVAYNEAAASFSFVVQSHATSVLVWDVPTAVAVGERFRFKVGIKCSNKCQLAGTEFGILDQDGALIATAALGSEPAPGTDALEFAEVELEAPEKAGLFQWSAKLPGGDIVPLGSEVALPHDGSAVTFGARAVDPPDFVVTVEAVDADKQTPIKGAQVVMDPYRAVTDERGLARVRVAKGEYKLFVSGPRYYRFGMPLEVTGDVHTKAELRFEERRERN